MRKRHLPGHHLFISPLLCMQWETGLLCRFYSGQVDGAVKYWKMPIGENMILIHTITGETLCFFVPNFKKPFPFGGQCVIII